MLESLNIIDNSIQIAIFIIPVLIGTFLGTITGLTPGLHINLVSVLILSSSPFLLKFASPETLFIVIICMALTHIFLDFIPSTFLGVPSEETATTIFPSHELVIQGEGVKAIILPIIGCILSFLFCLICVPFLIILFPYISDFLKGKVGTFLLFIILFIMYLEHQRDALKESLMIFGLAGVLGYFVLNSKISEPLFPLLSGLFGVSMIIPSIKSKSRIPPQRKLRKELIFDLLKETKGKYILISSFAGGLTGFLPGIGASQASIIGSIITKEYERDSYLLMQGGINTVNFFISLITFYTIAKPRNGALVVGQKLVRSISSDFLLTCLIALVTTAIIATILAILISAKISAMMAKIDYILLMKIILASIVIITFFLSGMEGIIIMVIASVIGTIAVRKNIPKHHCMACILVPVMLWTL